MAITVYQLKGQKWSGKTLLQCFTATLIGQKLYDPQTEEFISAVAPHNVFEAQYFYLFFITSPSLSLFSFCRFDIPLFSFHLHSLDRLSFVWSVRRSLASLVAEQHEAWINYCNGRVCLSACLHVYVRDLPAEGRESRVHSSVRQYVFSMGYKILAEVKLPGSTNGAHSPWVDIRYAQHRVVRPRAHVPQPCNHVALATRATVWCRHVNWWPLKNVEHHHQCQAL